MDAGRRYRYSASCRLLRPENKWPLETNIIDCANVSALAFAFMSEKGTNKEYGITVSTSLSSPRSMQPTNEHRRKAAFFRGHLAVNIDLIDRASFKLSPTASPIVALRLRRRKVKGPAKFVLMDKSDLVEWLSEGATPAFYLSPSGQTVCAKFKVRQGRRKAIHSSRSVSVARFIARCETGQSVSYANKNHLDLCRENLKPLRKAGHGWRLPKVTDILSEYRESTGMVMTDHDLNLYLIHPDFVDLETWTEKARTPRLGIAVA